MIINYSNTTVPLIAMCCAAVAAGNVAQWTESAHVGATVTHLTILRSRREVSDDSERRRTDFCKRVAVVLHE
jgi:hypothetical protein